MKLIIRVTCHDNFHHGGIDQIRRHTDLDICDLWIGGGNWRDPHPSPHHDGLEQYWNGTGYVCCCELDQFEHWWGAGRKCEEARDIEVWLCLAKDVKRGRTQSLIRKEDVVQVVDKFTLGDYYDNPDKYLSLTVEALQMGRHVADWEGARQRDSVEPSDRPECRILDGYFGTDEQWPELLEDQLNRGINQ